MQRYQPIYLTVSPAMKQAITKAAKKMAVSVNHLVNELLSYHFQGMVDPDETDTDCANYQRIVARLKLNAAIRSGKIKRQPCKMCGAEPAEGQSRLFEAFGCRVLMSSASQGTASGGTYGRRKP